MKAQTMPLIRRVLHPLLLLGVSACLACQPGISPVEGETPRQSATRAQTVREQMNKLRPLHTKLGKPQPGEWLAQHEEAGQNFTQYLGSKPVTPNGKRRVIYVQPLGDFGEKQREIVKLSAEFMGIYFDRPVKVLPDLPLSVVPAKARRMRADLGWEQILSIWIIDELLPPRLPDDAAALIVFTASDLWPGEGWNFVFGQASLSQRVGVWSLHRFGDPSGGDDAFRLCLSRTIKTATHETGHMFSMHHCTAYLCNMCGSNHLGEADRQPLFLCPECQAKLLWATGADPVAQFTKLQAFCEKYGLKEASEYYARAIKTLRP